MRQYISNARVWGSRARYLYVPSRTYSATHRTRSDQYANLRNEIHFPSFENLPRKFGIDTKYYGTVDGFHYSPIKHWCFLSEITGVDFFVRLRLHVKDKKDHSSCIMFYTDERGQELKPALLRKGYTVAVFYAEHHLFLDMNEGIRHETPGTIKIFPTSLNNLLSLSDKIQQYSTVEKNGLRTCQGCDSTSTSLQKCPGCGFFWYCNQACQTAGWRQKSHKTCCNLLKDADLKNMFLQNWATFKGFFGFPLAGPDRGDNGAR